MANLYLITLFKHPLLWLYHEMVALVVIKELAFSTLSFFLCSAFSPLAFSSNRLCSFNMVVSACFLNSSTFLVSSFSIFVCLCSIFSRLKFSTYIYVFLFYFSYYLFSLFHNTPFGIVHQSITSVMDWQFSCNLFSWNYKIKFMLILKHF